MEEKLWEVVSRLQDLVAVGFKSYAVFITPHDAGVVYGDIPVTFSHSKVKNTNVNALAHRVFEELYGYPVNSYQDIVRRAASYELEMKKARQRILEDKELVAECKAKLLEIASIYE